jgi:hypothetical protein
LGVTLFDRVFSMLLTCILIGSVVTLTFGAIWLTNHQWADAAAPAHVDLVDIDDVGGGNPRGIDGDPPLPGPETPEASVAENDIAPTADATKSVIEAVGNLAANPDELATLIDVGPASLVPGGARGTGQRPPLGDGPGGRGGVNRSKRWEISFAAGQTEQEYARQLDQFGVEIGAIVDGKIYFVSALASGKPVVRRASSGVRDDRLYFLWTGGGRRETDLRLLGRAGVPVGGEAVVIHFYPPEIEQRLARIELDYLKNAKATTNLRLVRKTRFMVVKDNEGYSFEITRQEYFGQPEKVR